MSDLFRMRSTTKRTVIHRRQSRFGAKIRTLRLQAGLSQGQLASAVGWQRHSVTMLESGRSLIRIPQLNALCRALKTTPNDLLEF
jgi:transcriptional regulator with XRE-family HTH domain